MFAEFIYPKKNASMLKILYTLFLSFLQVGLFSFGGGYATIPLIQQQVVNIHHYLTPQQFTDIITISQMTPGPLAVNTSTFVGIQIAGIYGAIIATFGCVLSGFVISIALYKFFQKYEHSHYVLETLESLKATSVGLIASSASTIVCIAFFKTSTFDISLFSPQIVSIVIFIFMFYILRKYKCNPIFIMICSGILGYFFY